MTTTKSIIPEQAKMVFKGDTFDVYHWEQEMFDGSKKIFERLKRSDCIDVVAVTPEGKIYILEEEQPGRDRFYGLVGGTCEEGEAPLETAKRELLEETGMVSDDRELFTSHTPSSRIAYQTHIFIARNCTKIQEQNLDKDGEKIKIHQMDWKEFLQILVHPRFRVQEFTLDVLKEIFLGNEEALKKKLLG